MLEFKDYEINKIDSTFTDLENAKLAHLYESKLQPDGRTVSIDGKTCINFTTNGGLALDTDKRVKSGIVSAINEYGSGIAVPLPYFLPPKYLEFEALLEQIFDAHPVIALTTTLTHLGTLPILIQENDLVILDFFAHNSMRMAVRSIDKDLTIKSIPHNDIIKLERLIQKASNDPNINNIWYLADGVYSMAGDLCPIKEVASFLDKYEKFYTYIDDAHGISIAGKHGRGYALSCVDKQHEKMIVIASLAKCFGNGCGGVALLPTKELKEKVRKCGSTFIFTVPFQTALYGSGIEIAKIHLSPEIELLQKRLAKHVALFNRLAKQYGIPVGNHQDPSHIFFITIGSLEKTIEVSQKLKSDGFMALTCSYPVVPKNSSGLRIVVTLHHTEEDIEALALSLSKHLQE